MIVCMMNDLDPRTDSAFIYQYLIFFYCIHYYLYILFMDNMRRICLLYEFLRKDSTMTCDT